MSTFGMKTISCLSSFNAGVEIRTVPTNLKNTSNFELLSKVSIFEIVKKTTFEKRYISAFNLEQQLNFKH
jgi:hypothetical protein